MIKKRPAVSGSSSSVCVNIANPAIPPPRANEPVSPIKMRAGDVFHHRKPKHAPAAAAAMMQRSSGLAVR